MHPSECTPEAYRACARLAGTMGGDDGGLARELRLRNEVIRALGHGVSALMGLETMKAAYAHAIEGGYRFYSYGDSSLLLPRRD